MISNKTTIENSLKRLILEDDREFVAMLSGEWGIGKSYFWEELTKNRLKDKNIIDISLFGKKSLEDIESEIITKLYQYNNNLKKYTKHLNLISNWISKATGMPINISLGSVLSLFELKDFKNIVICFDDFERLSEKVSLKDVMGLISQFKEQKECKIIMILNERELDKLSGIDGKKHDEIFALYKEKIVDYSFHYMPSQEELFEAIQDDIKKIKFCENEVIYDFFRKIALKNIRIMKQSLYQLEYFSFIGENNFDKKVIREFVEIALNLFIFKAKCNFNYQEFQQYESYIGDKSIFDLQIEDNQTKFTENHIYENCIKCCELNGEIYNFREKSLLNLSPNHNKIKEQIYYFIDNYILNKKELIALLVNNNDSLTYFTIQDKISTQYTRLLTNFSTPKDEIISTFIKLFECHKSKIHTLMEYEQFYFYSKVINKWSSDNSFKDVEEEIVKNYIKYYSRYDFNHPHNLIRDIQQDYDWTESYTQKYLGDTVDISPETIEDTIERMIGEEEYAHEDTNILLKASKEQYQDLILSSPSFVLKLGKYIRKYGKNLDSKPLSNLDEALSSIKDRSDYFKWKIELLENNTLTYIPERKTNVH